MINLKTYSSLVWYLVHVAILAGTVYLVTRRIDVTAVVLLLYPLSGVVLIYTYELVQEKRRAKALKKKIASFPRDSYGRWILNDPKNKQTKSEFESTGIGEL
jgi:hypothetical protein